jgi:hypothetical protein
MLYPAVVDADDLDACGALIKWMRVVSVSVVQNNLPGPTGAMVDLQVPLVDENLIAHCIRLQRLVLPGLYRPQETLERAITQMAVAVMQNTNETRVAGEQKAAQQAEPKLPSDRFTVTLGILQNYLQIDDECNLPLLWHRWVNCTKKQDFNVLSELLQAYARGPDKFTTCAPIATAKLVQDLLNFVFASESTDDIKTGLQPFIIADASVEHRQANLELARMYGMLNAGENTLLLSDLEALQAREVQSIPVLYFELERNLGMYGNLMGTVLGSDHVLTTTYRNFWTLLSQGYRQELQQLIDNKRFLKPAHVLRSIQLVCYNWFTQRHAQLTPQLPDFTSILYNIVLNTYVLPNLPPVLYKLAYPKNTFTPLPPLPFTGATSVTASSGSSSSGAGSNQSTMSGLTAPSLVNNRQRGAHVANLN